LLAILEGVDLRVEGVAGVAEVQDERVLLGERKELSESEVSPRFHAGATI